MPPPMELVRAVACAFFAVLFLQSGLDKVTDRKGNLEWLTGHFAASPFKRSVPLLLAVVTVTELSAGVCSLIGVVAAAVPTLKLFQFVGALLACTALLMLFAGQRIAKDYPGAATLAAYFGVGLLALLITVPASWS